MSFSWSSRPVGLTLGLVSLHLKEKGTELGVDIKKKTDVGAMLMPIDFSSSETNCCDLFLDNPHVPGAPPVPEEPAALPEQPEAEETSVDEVDMHRNLPEEPTARPEQPAAEETSADGVDSRQTLLEGPAAPDHPASRYPTRDRRQPHRYTVDEDGAAVMMCSEAPSSHIQALASSDAAQWRQAMDEEMASLHGNQTWDLQPLPPGRKAVACRWVFALKRDAKGVVERYKARLVAKGFSQKPGTDYGEIWAPVSKYKTLRTLLAVVATEDLHLHQLDIKTAFSNGVVEEEFYMQQPPGSAGQGDERVCRLRRTLYGLKQASRTWHLALRHFLCSLGFESSDADPCLFKQRSGSDIVFVLLYVDDMLIAAPTCEAVESVKNKLLSKFEARDMGEAGLFLGMSIVRDRMKILLWLHQGRYARDVVSRFEMADARAMNAPMARETQLRRGDLGGEPTDQPYAEVVGSLMYLMTCTRPDLAQSVGALSRFVSDPRARHWEAAVKVLRYVVGTSDLGLQFGGKTRDIVGYCDADYAGDLDSRKSTTAYVWLMHGGAVSWSSVLQPTVALSTAEAEYMAAAGAAREALWMRKILVDLGVAEGVPRIRSDSQSA
jgi:hypothetical protein